MRSQLFCPVGNSRFASTYFDTGRICDRQRLDIFDPSRAAPLDSTRACNGTRKPPPMRNMPMGYMGSWNANRIDELDKQESPGADQIEALQPTEEELAELAGE
jgi:hypothetical protein